MKTRFLFIGFCVLLMLGAVAIIGTALSEETQQFSDTTLSSETTGSIPIEEAVFSRSEQALAYQQMPEGDKSLTTYYTNRAFPGAPPMIPHPLVSEKGIGGKTCLQCHQNGGYVGQFKAYAPVTPHPEMLNCKQCHLPKVTADSFKSSNWEKPAPPAIHQTAFTGAPPLIPHALQMRENCLACHAGPGAAGEIRVSHPERVNCRQCHLPKHTSDFFKKTDKTIGFSDPKLDNKQLSQIIDWLEETN